jgi:hypothetical protein
MIQLSVVVLAEAGTQRLPISAPKALDSGLRRNDEREGLGSGRGCHHLKVLPIQCCDA